MPQCTPSQHNNKKILKHTQNKEKELYQKVLGSCGKHSTFQRGQIN
jgi:hypothetical protein